MKMKNTLILAMAVLLLTPAAGCKDKQNNSPPPAQAPENIQQEAGLKYGDITDPAELEQIWQEYLYDSIATVGNTREFNSAQEIDPVHVAKYCWLKYVNEHGMGSLALAGEDTAQRLFPLDTVLEYAERYFNLTSLNVSEIEAHYYDPQKHAFIFSGAERDRPAHTDRNPWGIHLDRVTRNSDGTITAVLVNYDNYRTGRIELTKTYTLKQREDGSLYFVSGRWDYVNNHLVTLTGDYHLFDEITGFDGHMEELFMLGEVNGRLILVYAPYDKEKGASLMLVNPETMIVEKKMEVTGDFASTDISLKGEIIVLRLKDRFIAVDKTLEQLDSFPLPTTITEKTERGPRYNDKGSPDVFFGGYDVSTDGKRYVYADEIGLKLFNAADNSERLLAKTVPINTGSKFLDNYYHNAPRFVAGEQKVITTIIGYEGAMDYTLCDLESGAVKTHRIAGECSSTGLIRYDTGLLEVNIFLRNEENQTSGYKTVYLDFQTGGVEEITLKDPGDTGDIRMPDHCYVGQNHAAFITHNRDNSDNADNMFYLNRLNLKTLLIEPQIISVKAADTHILGVLSDGRIVFWYSLNPSENGVCMTKF